jgi:hypothetical protein
MLIVSKIPVVVIALMLAGAGWPFALAQQSGQHVQQARPGEVLQGIVHREGDERYRLTFSASGPAMVEVSGGPADCAFQVGSQGFQESDSSPVDWTDGQPGQTVRHKFQVVAGRPGTIWVLLRSRSSGVSQNRWAGVACSNNGPFYSTPERGAAVGTTPASFEGRLVQPPIAFQLASQTANAPVSMAQSTAPRPNPGDPRGMVSLQDARLGFALSYPREWSAIPFEKGAFRLVGREDTPASEVAVTVTVVSKSANPNSSDMQQLLRVHERLTDAGAELVKLGPTTVADQTAAFASHAYDDNTRGKRTSFDHVQLVLDHGANYYLISFVAPHDVFVKHAAIFKQMLSSWRFQP